MGDASQNEEKVDRAFEVVEGMENKGGEENPGNGKAKSAKSGPSPQKGPRRSGVRVHFSMDALVSESDTQASSDSKLRPGAAKLLNIDFTLPYIWRIPVFGKTALKMVRRLQRDEYPDSIKDILRSLRK